MKEVTGDLWDFHANGHLVGITTNGYIKTSGENVMGRGVAQQAAKRFPHLPLLLGIWLGEHGNKVAHFPHFNLVTIPVKDVWWEPARLGLIDESLRDLRLLVDRLGREGEWTGHVALVRPGCGSGRLKWEAVKPFCEKYLDARFLIVEREA